MEDLCTPVVNRATQKRFNLANHVSASWMEIGLRLGIERNLLSSIQDDRPDNFKRLSKVFGIWLENATGLPHHADYPLSWQGLHTLLEDVEKTEVAKQYFEFLDNISCS
jgi:hypothetical protein